MKAIGHTCFLAIALVAGFAYHVNACELSGQVETNRLPIDRATIYTVRGTDSAVAHGQSAPDGRFSFQVPALSGELAALRVVIEKDTAKGEYILKRGRGDGCPEPRSVYELPAPPSGGSGGNISVGENLCVAPSALGKTIVLAPYQFFGAPESDFSERFNADLPRILYHRILAFQSRLGTGGTIADITVEPICSNVSVAEGERIRRIGSQLNALAVVVGEGEVIAGPDGKPIVELDSVFRTIPVFGSYGGNPVTIGDKLPGERLRPSRAAEWLDDAWGKQVLFAYALRQIADSATAADKVRLRSTRQLLIEMRKTMMAGDPFLPPLEALIGIVEQAIGP